MVRLIEMQRAHQIDIFFIQPRFLKKLPECCLYHSDTFFRRIDFDGIFFAERYKPVPDIAAIISRAFSHLFDFFFRNHSVAVEYARRFLQIFERGNLFFARQLFFRSKILICVRFARHIVKRTFFRVCLPLIFRGVFR